MTHDIFDHPTFKQKGLIGYRYPLRNGQVEAYFVDVSQGHDTYIISKKCTHIYYITKGKGEFEVAGQMHEVEGPCAMIEIPPGVEYTYFGKMEMLLIVTPPWFEGNEEIVKPNPRVL
jgi:hypothetical protein